MSGTVSGDGDEIDAYVLGVDHILEEFEGICIVLIRRDAEDDDKLIVVTEGTSFSDQEIKEATAFQENYFTSVIVRK